MCGIAGKLYFNPNRQVERDLILNMTGAIQHRGPDDEGIWIKNNVGLGHRRLSIIDLSPLGHQPMSDAGGKTWIAFNGEIYNYLELRRELEKTGVKFRSQTDTEVIIHLYKKHGVDCLKYLRGMFAFAIWDDDKKQLFLARDRVGKKPLKYYVDSERFIFASELKAILVNPEVKKEPDLPAVHHFLTFQYAPAPLTGFKNICKLPPAHFMVVRQDGTFDIRRYWHLDYADKWELSEKEWCQKIMEKLEESVRLRMISDVPLGAFLSGGIDSSAIVGLMAKISPRAVKTFTIGFEETSHNEIPYAREIADRFKTEHTEFVVKPNAVEILPQLVYQYEEPYADSSTIPTWYLAQLTRKYVTVALNGDGGDENFGGYTRYNAYKLLDQLQKMPKTLRRKLLPQITKILVRYFFRGPRKEKLLRFVSRIGETPQRSYLELVCYFNREQKNTLYTDYFKKIAAHADPFSYLEPKFAEAKNYDWLDQVLYVDFNTYLPDDLMVKVDIATMAHALEGRSPLLDHEFLELTAKIPSNLKLKGQVKKYIFKKALEKLLPLDTLHRTKMGFGIPIEHWFRQELNHFVKDILLSNRAINRGLFKEEEIRRLIEDHTQRKINHAHHLWALLTLEYWFRTFFD